MNREHIQKIIDRAVSLATKMALNGNLVNRVIWIPCDNPTSDPDGQFVPISADGLLTSADK